MVSKTGIRALVLWLVVLAGCAGNRVSPEQRQTIRELHVASLLPAGMPVKVSGDSIFKSREESVANTDWRVDEVITREVGELLGPQKIIAVPFRFDAAEAGKIVAEGKKSGLGFLVGESKLMARAVLDLAQRQGLAHLLLIEPVKHEDFRAYPPGYGIICRKGPGLSQRLQGYGMYSLTIWDAKKKAQLYTASVSPESSAVEGRESCDDVASEPLAGLAARHAPLVESSFKKALRAVLDESGLL